MAVKPLYPRHQQCNTNHIQEHQKSFSLINTVISAGILFDRGDYPFVIVDIIAFPCLLALCPKVMGRELYQFFHLSFYCYWLSFSQVLSEICLLWKVTFTKKCEEKPGEILMLSKVLVGLQLLFTFLFLLLDIPKERLVVFMVPPILCGHISFSCSLRKCGCVSP